MEDERRTDENLAVEGQKRVIVIEATERPQNVKLRVAAYIRVSSDSEDQLNSFAAQNQYYSTLISSKENWTMTDIYAERGITGTSARKRPEFLWMIRLCRQKKVDIVLTKSISRFARNTVDCLNYLEAKLATTEKEWYIRAVRQFGWSKSELLRQMEAEAHLTLDLPGEVCYTVENAAAEEETNHAQAKDHQCHGTGSPGAANGVSALLPLPHSKLFYRGIHTQPLLACGGHGRPVIVAGGTGPPGRRQDVSPKDGTGSPDLAKFIG